MGDFNCRHPLWNSRGSSDLRGEKVFDRVISLDLLPLNDPDTPTLFHRYPGSRSAPDITFAPSSPALSCCWHVLQNLGSNHLQSFLTAPLSPLSRRNKRPPFHFQKASYDDFAIDINSHHPSADGYSSLSSATALFIPLARNVAKSFILFGRIQRQPQAWWSSVVKEAVRERRKAFSVARRSDKNHQVYISASKYASSDITEAKAKAWHVTCSSPSLLNLIPSQFTLPFVPLLVLLLLLPLPLTFPTALLPRRRHRFVLTT